MKSIVYMLLLFILCACSVLNDINETRDYKKIESKLPDIVSKKETEKKLTSASYETYLNKEFYNQCQDCNIINLKYSFIDSKCYIPYKLLRNIPESDSILCFNYGMNELLLCYFKENLKKTGDFSKKQQYINDDIELLINEDMLASFKNDQLGFVPSYVYTRSCSGYLKSMMDNGIKPPMSSIKNTLTSEQQNNSVVTVLYGTFYSAIGKLLNENGNPLANYIYFQLYDIYKEDADLKIYYLKNFTGISYNRITDQNAIRQLSNSIGLNVSAPVSPILTSISSNINIEAILKNKEVFFGGFPKTLIDLSKCRFDTLPNKKETIDFLSSIVIYSPKDFKINKDVDYYYRFEIPGVPLSRCNKYYWKKETNPGYIQLVNVEPDKKAENSMCGCLITLKINSKNFNEGFRSDSITLKYSQDISVKHRFGMLIDNMPTLKVRSVDVNPFWKESSPISTIGWDELSIDVKSGKETYKTCEFVKGFVKTVDGTTINIECSDCNISDNEITVKGLYTLHKFKKSDDNTTEPVLGEIEFRLVDTKLNPILRTVQLRLNIFSAIE